MQICRHVEQKALEFSFRNFSFLGTVQFSSFWPVPDVFGGRPSPEHAMAEATRA